MYIISIEPCGLGGTSVQLQKVAGIAGLRTAAGLFTGVIQLARLPSQLRRGLDQRMLIGPSEHNSGDQCVKARVQPDMG